MFDGLQSTSIAKVPREGSMRHLSVKLMAAMAALALPGSALADVTYLDGTFAPGDYSVTPIFTSNATLTESQCGSCGNPGEGEQIVLTSQANTTFAGDLGIVNTTFTYNPQTQGAITSINASVDKDLTDDPAPTIEGTNTFHPMIEQDGNYYVASIPGPSIPGGGTTTNYNNIAGTGLTASDFTLYDFATGAPGVGHPNFDGDPIVLGLAQEFGGSGSVVFTETADYDNLAFSIAGVPEPATWAMMLLGFFGLGVLLRAHHRADRDLAALAAG
jgi:hypothetical protein